jgi:hypothetical protein
LGVLTAEAGMTDSTTPKKSTRKARRKKVRRRIWFEATVQNNHVHMQASAPTRWFRVLRWVILIVIIALIMRFLPELWQAIQVAFRRCRSNGRTDASADCAILSSSSPGALDPGNR